LGLAKDGEEHGHVAEGDRFRQGTQDDPNVAAIISQVAQQAPAEACEGVFTGDFKIFLKKSCEKLTVARQKRLAQTKKLDFLDSFIAGQQGFNIVEQARFRGAACEGSESHF